MAQMISPLVARRVAYVMSPSTLAQVAWARCATAILTPAGPWARPGASADVAACLEAARSGAQKGMTLGYGAALMVSAGSFAGHAFGPRHMQRLLPMPNITTTLFAGAGGASVHVLGLGALDWAAKLQQPRLQAVVLGTLFVVSLATEAARMRCSVVWVGLPMAGAALGAAAASASYGLSRGYALVLARSHGFGVFGALGKSAGPAPASL